MKKLRMGIIGTGGIAQNRHIPAYLGLEEFVELTALYDSQPERAKEAAEKFGVPLVCNTYEELFEQVDAVTICTPNKFHAEMAIAALQAGVHVLCEKPMAMTTAECRAMQSAAEQSGKILSIAYHYRFTEALQTAKKTMQDGVVGDPLVVRVRAMRRRKVPGWGVFTNRELQGGGSLIDYGCHLLDAALWLLDNPEPVHVFGKTYNNVSKRAEQLNDWGPFNSETFDVDDHVTAYLTFENGASLLFECSWAANIKEDTIHLSISGSEGGINVYPFEIYEPKYGKYFTSETEAAHNEQEAGMLQAENFVKSCLGLEKPIVTVQQAIQVNQVIEEIYRSAQEKSLTREGET